MAKCTGKEAKIILTFEQSDGRTIHSFHLHNSPRETEWQCTFNKRTMYGAVGANKTLPIQNVWATQQISSKTILTHQSTCFICIIYQGKHNGIALLTYEYALSSYSENKLWNKQLQEPSRVICQLGPDHTSLIGMPNFKYCFKHFYMS